MKKHFGEKQLQSDNLVLENIYPLDLIEFIYDIEKATNKIIPTDKIKPDNFKDLDSIHNLIE